MTDINDVGAEAWLQEVRERGGIASGGPLLDFAGGWAQLPMCGDVAHYWRPRRDVDRAVTAGGVMKLWQALCHFEGSTEDRRPALARGNVPFCKHCQRQARKQRLA